MSASVTVFCVGCRTETEVRSRTAFSVFDDQHREACGVRAVLYRSTLDDLLDLPPDALTDLTGTEPAWHSKAALPGESRAAVGAPTALITQRRPTYRRVHANG